MLLFGVSLLSQIVRVVAAFALFLIRREKAERREGYEHMTANELSPHDHDRDY
jgi:hypothetical protein